jgi:asparagine synthase (glutamine-hydrolysing)
MCGIAGFLGGPLASRGDATIDVLRAMGDAIVRRGPDSDGYWQDEGAGIGLAHRRLAIVDLSAEGAQPMRSASGRFMLCYNGEIYNHRELRTKLRSPWRGTSDTETLLAGFDAWGIRATLEASVGMFAVAIWDFTERRLILARDRFGEKPLYYGWQCRSAASTPTFMFGSDLSALRAHPEFAGQISRDSLRSYVRLNYIGDEQSIYLGIRKLPPGCLISIAAGAGKQVVEPERYWASPEVARRSRLQPFVSDDHTAINELEQLLTMAVSQQIMADVPVGAFLSGGVDSSTIVAMMQKVASAPVRTFTVGFQEADRNEATHARAVAKHLGTDHTELYVTPQDALRVIPDLASIYSEPFADSSQIPTHLLARLTRAHVTVALSGDCGDELFCGYNRYIQSVNVWRRAAKVPILLRKLAARALLTVPASLYETVARLGREKSAAGRWTRLGEKIQKFSTLLPCRDADELYLSMISHWSDPGEIVIGGHEPPPLNISSIPGLANFDLIEQMMMVDVLSYMNEDILTKVDRAAMATSLETRVPMLDHRVAEFAWRLPLHLKLRDGQSKWILRQVLYRHVPKALIERPKSGFAVPIDEWLRGPLRDWAEGLLDAGRIERAGYLRAAPIRRRWAEHLSGRRNWYSQLWNVLMFQSWLERNHAL